MGYATSQLRRLENFLAETEYTQEEKNKYIKQTMDVAMTKLEDKNRLFKEGAIKVNLDKENKLAACDRQPIKIYINSQGGDLTAAYSIIDTIRKSETPV